MDEDQSYVEACIRKAAEMFPGVSTQGRKQTGIIQGKNTFFEREKQMRCFLGFLGREVWLFGVVGDCND